MSVASYVEAAIYVDRNEPLLFKGGDFGLTDLR
jgi:uncharacterized protein with PIN domain